MCPETEYSRTQGRENEFYIEKGGEPEVKSSFCHVVSQLARGARQSGPASWGYGSGIAQLPRCANITASFGISANPLALGSLCSIRPVGTPRGAKLPLVDTLGHAGPMGAWGFAGAYHTGLVLIVHCPPRTNPVPKMATNRQPNQE